MYSPSGFQGKQNSKVGFNYSQVSKEPINYSQVSKESINYSQVRSSSPVNHNHNIYNHNNNSNIYNHNNNNNIYNNSSYTNSNYNNLKQSVSTRQFTQARSQQNLHILKLQSRALEQLRKLQHQKFQILTLTQQTEQLMRLCDQQKSYIKSVNIDMMRQEYQEELKYLSQERNKLLEMITIIKQEKQLYNNQKQQQINMARMDNLLLSQKIEQALLKKQQLLKVKHENNDIKNKYQQKITQQEEKLDQLRHVQRKLAISLKEIQRLRKEYLQSS